MSRAFAATLVLAACGEQRLTPVDVSPGCPQPPVADEPMTGVVVSDFERGLGLDGALALDGHWDVGSDGSDPDLSDGASAACATSGLHAFHVRAPNGLTDWGWYGNLVFRSNYAAQDLRAYRAITFWAAAGGPDAHAYDLLAGLETSTVNPNGKLCTMCGDVYAARIQVDGRWRRFRLPFDSLVQAGWGKPSGLPLALDKVLDFALRADGKFDLWLDRVELEPMP